MKNNFIIIILLIFLANSCVGTSSQVLFGTGVSVATDPRSIVTQIDDNIIEKNLIARLLVNDKKYLSVNPLTETAEVTDEGPGIEKILISFLIHSRTIIPPGSDMHGVPASDIKEINF